MRVINGISRANIKMPTAVAVGVFDGVHKGHKKILKELKRSAKNIKGKSCVLTFAPHPATVLRPHKKPRMLISTRHKLNLFAAAGIDIAVLINFTKKFAEISPDAFVEDILVRRLNVRELLVGDKFLFGRKKSGNIRKLKELGKIYGFSVRSIRHLKTGTKVISSTLIRTLIMSGSLDKASSLMGREVAILGTVTRGARRGKALGFPTANLNLHHEAIPPSGVYAVKVKLGSRKYRGVLNIGFRPTFGGVDKGKDPTAEVHIFGLRRSIYGKDIEVIFAKRIRRECKFKSLENLRLRIKKDIDIAKKYFGRGRK